MAIEFICPACHGMLSMADDAAGRLVRCGNCQATLRVPDAAPAPPTYEVVEPLRPKRPEPRYEDDGRDEHGEPRTRRVKQKAGRGALFWIVIILLALGLFTCLACGGGILILATPRWHKHDSQNGGYTVELPAPINPNVAREAKLELKKNEVVEGALLAGRLELYWVWYAPFEGGFRPGVRDQEVLDKAVKDIIKDGDGVVVKETPRTVDGCAAREVIVSLDDGQTHHCLIVVGKTKLYIVQAGGPFVGPEGNPRIRKFLDSFHMK